MDFLAWNGDGAQECAAPRLFPTCALWRNTGGARFFSFWLHGNTELLHRHCLYCGRYINEKTLAAADVHMNAG